jgi:hypothetical protein
MTRIKNKRFKLLQYSFMKKIIAVFVVLFLSIQFGFSQTDSLVKEINKKTEALKDSVAKMKKELKDSLQAGFAKKECNCVANETLVAIGPWEGFLVLLPFVLLIAVIVFILSIKGFAFKDALTENEPPKKIIKNPEYNAAAIAANATIANLSLLFPATIEVSNVEPTLTDLQQIVASKDAAVKALQKKLDDATGNKEVSDAAAANAGTALKKLQDATEGLADTAARAKKDTEANPVDSTKTEALTVANLALTNNTNAIAAAQKIFDDENQKVKEIDATIASLKAQIANATKEAEDARNDVDNYKKGPNYSPAIYRPSISRYIALITSLVTIILVVCMSSFFIYHYIRTGCPPEFGALTAVIIALGLGVTPYITNKITTAASAGNS